MSTFSTTWAAARDAADHLGVSTRTLYRWRDIGLLRPGVHWRRKFPATNSPVLYDLPATEQVMRELARRCADKLEVSR